MLLSASDLVLNANGVRVRPQRIAKEHLLRVDRGIYVGADKLGRDPSPWKVRARVAEARLLALGVRSSNSDVPVFTGESAMVVLGIEPWWNNPNVTVRRKVRSGTKTDMRAIQVGSTTVPQTQIKQTDTFIGPLNTPLITRCGLAISPLPIVILDLVRSAHPLQAFHDVSLLLRFHTRFSRWQLDRSRSQTAQIKSNIHNDLRALRASSDRRIHGFRRALALLHASEPGIESPAESIVLWALHCILDAGYSIQSQRAFSANGRHRFVDIAIPEARVAIEVSGFGKFGDSSAEAHRVASAAVERQQDLEDLGWRIVNVSYEQATDIENLVSYLAKRLGALGIRTHMAQGLLWAQPNHQLFERHRRT